MTNEDLLAPRKIVSLRPPTGMKERWAIAQQRVEAGDSKSALDIWESIASEGYVEAYVEIGNIHEIGTGDVLQNLEEAAKWYRKAIASFDDPFAHARLGAMYYNGIGAPRDRKKALHHLLKAEPAKQPQALVMLGVLFHLGGETEVNLDRARSLYRAAADQGYVLAMHYLSSLEANAKNYLASICWRFRAMLATFKIARSDPHDSRLDGIKQP